MPTLVPFRMEGQHEQARVGAEKVLRAGLRGAESPVTRLSTCGAMRVSQVVVLSSRTSPQTAEIIANSQYTEFDA